MQTLQNKMHCQEVIRTQWDDCGDDDCLCAKSCRWDWKCNDLENSRFAQAPARNSVCVESSSCYQTPSVFITCWILSSSLHQQICDKLSSTNNTTSHLPSSIVSSAGHFSRFKIKDTLKSDNSSFCYPYILVGYKLSPPSDGRNHLN